MNIKAEAEKAYINLYVEGKDEPSTWTKPRNGPSRQRRREGRQAARDAAGTVAVEESEEQASEKDNTNDVIEKSAEAEPITSEEE